VSFLPHRHGNPAGNVDDSRGLDFGLATSVLLISVMTATLRRA
jgi:hypothetical protein